MTTRIVSDLLARRVHRVPRLRQRFHELRARSAPAGGRTTLTSMLSATCVTNNSGLRAIWLSWPP